MTSNEFDALIARLNRFAHNRRTATDSGQACCYVALPPITMVEVRDAEVELGFSLPPLLIRLFTEVGNGGFGPNYGLLPLSECVKEYRERIAWNAGADVVWPKRMLPIVDHGCGNFFCLLVIEAGENFPPVISFESNLDNEEHTRRFLKGAPYIGPGFLPLRKSFPLWLTEWVEGRERAIATNGEN